MLFTDGSVRNKLSGAAVVYQKDNRLATLWSSTIGWATTCPILLTELVAIREALLQSEGRERLTPTTIVTDSQAALQAIARGNKSTQARALVRDIAAGLLRMKGKIGGAVELL